MKQAKKWWKTRWKKWLDARIPATRHITLTQRRIFILPTKQGVFFAVTVFLLFLGGTNYQNSLLLAMSFLLGSLFILTILHTYRNLSGVVLRAGHPQPGFAGSPVLFPLFVAREGEREYESLQLKWENNPSVAVDLYDTTEICAEMWLLSARRGWFRPGRLLVETRYPLGLFRAWSWLDMDMECLVYPKPLPSREVPRGYSQRSAEQAVMAIEGQEDFYQLKKYQEGDSLHLLAWKTLAKGQGMYTKQFAGWLDQQLWLDLASAPGQSLEGRLSYLCYWVLKLSDEQKCFGLQLGNILIEPDKGEAHRAAALKALALYGAGHAKQ